MCVHRDTGAQRAVKVLRKAHMDEDEKKMLFNEINILRNLVSIANNQPYIFALAFLTAPLASLTPVLLCTSLINIY